MHLVIFPFSIIVASILIEKLSSSISSIFLLVAFVSTTCFVFLDHELQLLRRGVQRWHRIMRSFFIYFYYCRVILVWGFCLRRWCSLKRWRWWTVLFSRYFYWWVFLLINFCQFPNQWFLFSFYGWRHQILFWWNWLCLRLIFFRLWLLQIYRIFFSILKLSWCHTRRKPILWARSFSLVLQRVVYTKWSCLNEIVCSCGFVLIELISRLGFETTHSLNGMLGSGKLRNCLGMGKVYVGSFAIDWRGTISRNRIWMWYFILFGGILAFWSLDMWIVRHGLCNLRVGSFSSTRCSLVGVSTDVSEI